MMRPSPGPPWLSIPNFAREGTLHLSNATYPISQSYYGGFLTALVMLDRRFDVTSISEWQLDDSNIIGQSEVSVPNGSEFWGLFVQGSAWPAATCRPQDIFRVQWSLAL